MALAVHIACCLGVAPFMESPGRGATIMPLNEGRSHFNIFLLNHSTNAAQVWHRLIEQKKK
jgi:hypothetical protein